MKDLSNLTISLCEKISLRIMELKKKHEFNTGLFYGDISDCLFLYRFNTILRNPVYENNADHIFDAVFSENNNYHVKDKDIFGIGLSVQYLFMYNLCDGDEEQILKDFDDKIFLLSIDANSRIDFFEKLYYQMIYYTLRLRSNKLNHSSCEINERMFYNTINEIYEAVVNSDIAADYMVESSIFDLLNKYIVLLETMFIVFCLESSFDKYKIKMTISSLVDQILTVWPSSEMMQVYQCVVLKFANMILKRQDIQVFVKLHTDSINVTKLFDMLDFELIGNVRHGAISQMLVIFVYLNMFDKNENYKKQIAEAFEISNYCIDMKMEDLDAVGIYGYSGIGLILLHYYEYIKTATL